jgi:hypothetical protein
MKILATITEDPAAREGGGDGDRESDGGVPTVAVEVNNGSDDSLAAKASAEVDELADIDPEAVALAEEDGSDDALAEAEGEADSIITDGAAVAVVDGGIALVLGDSLAATDGKAVAVVDGGVADDVETEVSDEV